MNESSATARNKNSGKLFRGPVLSKNKDDLQNGVKLSDIMVKLNL